jgi:glycine cleavage system H protein
VADESYPDELLYHPEHDWARVEDDEATFGITWYAQDALGEVVFFDAPEEGTHVAQDQAYAEVESVKAVSSEADKLLDAGAYRDLLQSSTG